MQIINSLLAGAAFVSAVAAQGRIQFTEVNPDVSAGEPVIISWTGGSDAPVTIKLRQGKSTDLHDVAVLTSDGSGGSYTWTPETTLPEGSDYAFEISQGDDVNYTAQFPITGGSGEYPAEEPSASDTYPVEDPTPTDDTYPTGTATETETATTTSIPTYTATDVTYSVPSTSTPSSSPSSTLVSQSSYTTPSATPTYTPSEYQTPTGPATPAFTGGAASMASPVALVLGIFAAMVYFN